jgi:hypothetical protein
MRNAEKTLKKKLGTALYNDGTTSKAWQGLNFLTGDTAITPVGGIDSDDFSGWIAYRNATVYSKANMDDPSNAAYIIKLLQLLIRNTTIDGEKPTMIVMPEDVFDILELVLEGTKAREDKDLAKVGFESIVYRNVTIVPDSFCTATCIFALHEDYSGIRIHKDANFDLLGWVRPYNSEARFNQLIVSGNFISSALRTLGVLSNITA